MKWSIDNGAERRAVKRRAKHTRLTTHTRWFAWRPVSIYGTDDWVWCVWVTRHKMWWKSTTKWEPGVGIFGGPGFTGANAHFGVWRYLEVDA